MIECDVTEILYNLHLSLHDLSQIEEIRNFIKKIYDHEIYVDETYQPAYYIVVLDLVSNERYENYTFLLWCFGIDFAPIKRYHQFYSQAYKFSLHLIYNLCLFFCQSMTDIGFWNHQNKGYPFQHIQGWIYCTRRAKTSCQIMFACHSKLTRTKTICELFMTCHPNMTNVLIAFVFLFTGKQKS